VWLSCELLGGKGGKERWGNALLSNIAEHFLSFEDIVQVKTNNKRRRVSNSVRMHLRHEKSVLEDGTYARFFNLPTLAQYFFCLCRYLLIPRPFDSPPPPSFGIFAR